MVHMDSASKTQMEPKDSVSNTRKVLRKLYPIHRGDIWIVCPFTKGVCVQYIRWSLWIMCPIQHKGPNDSVFDTQKG